MERITNCSFFVLLYQLLLANKSANGSGEVLVAPIPPSYEEATAGIPTTCPTTFTLTVSVVFFSKVW